MMKLDLVFSGLSIVKRDDIYLSRNLESFGNLLDYINGVPVLLEHPKDIETETNSLLTPNSEYTIIGTIDTVIDISDTCIRVCANIIDPVFIEFYNSLSDEEKKEIHISPAVSSDLGEMVEIDGNKIYHEVINKIDHLAICVSNNGFWMKYIDDQPVRDIELVTKEQLENSSIENIDYIGSVESTSNVSEKKLSPIVDNDEEKIQLNINNNNNEVSMEEKIEKEIASEVANDVIPEEIKEEASELSQEEVAHVVEEVKELNEILDSEEEIKEEVKEEEKIDECGCSDENKIDSEEEVKEDVEEESQKIDEEEDKEVIDEEFETEADEEREELVKVVGNLCDSVEGFRKPAMSKRYTPEAYVRKALSLNKQFIDKKYHSLIDSIDASSLEFGKELLDSIKGSEVKEVKSHKSDYVQVAPNLYMKKFF